ncbi:MAG: lysophospholipid acyltransferase family protein [Candidatus Omnitrophica bacterium]|nr:lysophospholipid acyltransferase family protein [Candidatus Omnitrophota bacterium]
MGAYFLFRLAFFLARRLPLSPAYRAAEILAALKYYTVPQERRAMLRNFSIIRGGAPSEHVRGVREVYRNFGRYLVDFFRSEKIDARFVREAVSITGIEYIDQGLQRGNGVIGLTVHIGNWELSAQLLAVLGYPMNAIALPHRDPAVNRLFDAQRSVVGVKVIPLGVSIRQCFAALRRNEIVGILGDRDFSGSRTLRVPFLGTTIALPRGPAVLSYRTGAAIVPGFVVRDRDNFRRFEFILESPIVPDKSVDEETALVRLTEQYARVMEKYVRLYPEQWFLFHDIARADPQEGKRLETESVHSELRS